MSFLHLTLCCFVLFYGLGTDIVAASENFKVNHVWERGDYSHFCNVTESPDVHVWWSKNQTGSSFHIDGRRLWLPSINRTDAGDYVCHVETVNTTTNVTVISTEERIRIDVRYNPTLLMRGGPSLVAKGGNFSVTCEVTDDNPRAKIVVLQGDIDHIKRSNILGRSNDTEFLKVNLTADCSNSGPYTCIAYNDGFLFMYVSKSIHIEVLCTKRAPVPDGNITYVREERLSESVTFTMRTSAFPQANFTWSHNNVTLTKGITSDFYNTSLEIEKIKIADYGNYTLVMQNTEGSSMAFYQLIPPAARPEPPTQLNYFHPTYTTVALAWFTGFDYGLETTYAIVHWINGYYYTYSVPIVDSYNASSLLGPHHMAFNLTHLDPDTLYEFSVMAENTVGHSTPSNRITFRTKKHIWKEIKYVPPPAIKGYSFDYKLFLEIFGGVAGAAIIVYAGVFIWKKRLRPYCRFPQQVQQQNT